MNWLLAIIIWRILLFILAIVSSSTYKFQPSFPYSDIYLVPSGLPQWLWSWANFDGVHYITIAKIGYSAQFTQTFFPLYPLVLRLIGILFHDTHLILSGLVFSLTLFTFALHYLRKLWQLDYAKNEVNYMLVSLLLFPTSFFFAAVYTEATFLCLVALSFWWARQKRWWLSGIAAGLASATRLTGVFLLPSLLWEWYEDKNQSIRQAQDKKSKIKIKKNILSLTYLLSSLKSPILYLVPLGLIIYMLYLKIAFGDALYFWHAQPVFGASRSGGEIVSPIRVVWRYVKILTTVQISSVWAIAASELLAFIIGCWFLVLGHRYKIRVSYLIFGWLVLVVPTLTGTFSSLARYLLTTFPIFMVIGLTSQRIRWIIWTLEFIGLVFFTLRFVSGQWVA